MRSNTSLKHGLLLGGFSFALFLPLIGGGFVHDDFMWLYNVAYRPRWYGLTNPTPTFYTPLTWLSFKIDWALWGFRAFPIAVENLLLHVGNTLLLYGLAWRLWGSRAAAWWAAFGFALLYMANSWAVMWISARTHLLATLFCLAAMLTAVGYARAGRRKWLSALGILGCCALSMLAKEIGVASVAAVLIVLSYTAGLRRLIRDAWASTGLLIIALMALLCVYLALREWAGAVSVSANQGWYQYTPEFGVLLSNLREYLSRTYLIACVWVGALALSQLLRGARPRLNALTRREVLMSLALFAVTIAPVILIRGRSGLYTYLPGVGAALLLGATARAMCENAPVVRPHTWLSMSPLIIVTLALCVATVGQSWKWRTMARTNTAVLAQMAQQEPQPERGSRIVLWYAGRDKQNRFPDGFATWGFPFAVRLLYRDPELRGRIAAEGEIVEPADFGREVSFQYSTSEGYPRVMKRE